MRQSPLALLRRKTNPPAGMILTVLAALASPASARRATRHDSQSPARRNSAVRFPIQRHQLVELVSENAAHVCDQLRERLRLRCARRCQAE